MNGLSINIRKIRARLIGGDRNNQGGRICQNVHATRLFGSQEINQIFILNLFQTVEASKETRISGRARRPGVNEHERIGKLSRGQSKEVESKVPAIQ